MAMYFKNTIPFIIHRELEILNLEVIWAEVSLKGKRLLIGTFYIHPRFSDWNLIDLSIEQAIQLCPNIILIGDFNQNLKEPRKSKNIRNIINTYNLQQLVETPTRSTSTLIDLILISDSLHAVEKGVIEPFCSDHSAVYFSTNFISVSERSYKRKIWQYNNAVYELYRETLDNMQWNFTNLSVEDQVQLVTKNMTRAAENSIPHKIVAIRPKDQPWMHNEIRKLMRIRNRQHKIAKRTNNPNHWARFRELRNQVINSIREAKVNHFKKLATNLQNGNLSPKDWWKITKQFLKQNKDNEIPPLSNNGIFLSDPQDKATLLNSYFCEQSSVDDSHATLPPHAQPINNLNNITITEEDVSDILKTLDTSKASGPDSISPRLLKEGKWSLARHLATLFNNSLQSSIFPSSWKLANIIPVFKKGDESETSNYRPISILSCIGKVFERCVFKYLHNYIITNRLITSYQSGFTPKDSAVNQLIDICNAFAKAVDEGKEIRVIFCDISKASDRVWHRGLLFKLRRMGISGPLLDWFQSYLSQRFQRVAMEGCASEFLEIKAGVPQGSILGPLLFLIYINDIVDEIETNIRLFADDTTLYLVVDNPTRAADLLNSDLHKVHNWSKDWLVKFNPNKTEELVISRKTLQPRHPPLYMNNVQIKQVDSHKHIGVTLNNNCSWGDHINDITCKAWKRVNLLRTLKFQLDRRTLQTMYTSFIRANLEYADTVWDNCTQTEITEIEKIQTEAMRIVTGATKSCSKLRLLEETGWTH